MKTEANKKGITRRDFIKNAAVGTAGVASISLLGACAPKVVQTDPSLMDTAATAAADSETVAATPASRIGEVKETYDADIVVVGGGGSGMSAALEAANDGKNVILFEKLAATGGSSQFAEGIAAVESSVQKEQGITLTKEFVYDEFINYSHWRANPDVVSAFVNHCAETVDWLKSMGVVYTIVTAFNPDSDIKTWHFIDGKVASATKAVYEYGVKAGVNFMMETSGIELLLENNQIIGVLGEKSDGTVIKVNTKAVVLGTGGYARNPDMIRKYTQYDPDTVNPGGSLGNTGDGIRMAFDSGADDFGMGLLMLNGATVEGKSLTSHVNNAATQPYLWVNTTGKRYSSEMAVMEFPNAGNVLANQPGGIQFTILDSDLIKHLVEDGNEIGVGAYVLTGTKLTELEAELEDDLAKGVIAFKSDTIEGLAQAIGVDPTTLAETVEDYNRICDQGVDDKFYKPKFLYGIKTAPFYALKSKNTFVITIGGIKINGNMEVIGKDNLPIGGLYAVGVDGGGLYGDTYSANLAGAACGFAFTSGRIAAQSAIKYIG